MSLRAGRLRDNQFLRFLAVGGLNTLFGYGLFSLLVLAGTAPGIALFAATLVGVLFNYATTGRLVFAARGFGRLPWFACVYGLTFLINLWSLKGLIAAGLSPLLAQAVLLPAVTILAFALNKLLVFRAPVMKTISIATPCFNEEANARDCYEAVKALFDGPLSAYRREHVFADNCSTDRTVDILREIAATDPDVKVIVNARNFGPLRSTYNAVLATSGDAILLFLPADMQDPPALLPEFVKLWEQGYEIVYGIRATRAEGWLMRSVRRVYYRIISKFSYVAFPPDVGDFQLVDRKVLDAMRKTEDAYPFMRMMTFESEFRAVGVPYHWLARKKGFSKNSFFNLVDQGLNGIITFTTVPLRAALFLGTAISIFSLIYAFATLVVSLLSTGRLAEPGIPTLIVALFFFAGIQIFFMGLLGEYILAIYGQVRKKPMVIERERINFPKE